MKRFTFLVLRVLCVLVVLSCGGSTSYYATGCYCREGYRLAKGNHTEKEASLACATWPKQGFINEAFDAFNNDQNLELYCNERAAFTKTEIDGYFAKSYRMTMRYPVVAPNKCPLQNPGDCADFTPVYKYADIRPDTSHLCVAGQF